MSDLFLHIITRNNAKFLGMKRFFTGEPCAYGHISGRFCNEGKCCECNKVRCATRHKEKCDREEGRAERISAKIELAASRKAERIERSGKYSKRKYARRIAIESGAKTYHGKSCKHDGTTLRYTSGGCCVECLSRISASEEKKQYDKIYAYANKERIRLRSAAYLKANRSRMTQKSREWSLANPEKRRLISMNYSNKRRARIESGITTSRLSDWAESQKKICYWCFRPCHDAFHVDHYYPLSKGGLHEVENLVISCPSCNLRKSSKDPIAWAQENGRLL